MKKKKNFPIFPEGLVKPGNFELLEIATWEIKKDFEKDMNKDVSSTQASWGQRKCCIP